MEGTAQLFTKVLDGKQQVAQQLADLVHSEVTIATDASEAARELNLPVDNLAVWIDPIGKFCMHEVFNLNPIA